MEKVSGNAVAVVATVDITTAAQPKEKYFTMAPRSPVTAAILKHTALRIFHESSWWPQRQVVSPVRAWRARSVTKRQPGAQPATDGPIEIRYERRGESMNMEPARREGR